jgi:hypothetical protein
MAEKSDVNDVGVSDTVDDGAVVPPVGGDDFDPELPQADNARAAASAMTIAVDRFRMTCICYPRVSMSAVPPCWRAAACRSRPTPVTVRKDA